MPDTVLSRAIADARAATAPQTGSCKWCFPTRNEHACYVCICSISCDSGHCPMSAAGAHGPSDLCGIPVEIAPVPVFRASDA